MLETFVKEKRVVRILQRNEEDYLTGYILEFDKENRLIKFLGDQLYIIPLTSILHLYQPK
jgi:hypothetical protein